MGLFRPYERNDKVAEQSRLSTTKAASAKAHADANAAKAHADASEAKATTELTAAKKTATVVAPADKKATTVVAPAEENDDAQRVSAPVRKKVATPTRREAEQARRDRLHPTLSKKETKARERQIRMEKRTESVKTVEAQPGRVLVRDYIDSKRRVTGYTMPMILGALLLSILGSMVNSEIFMVATSVFVWVVLGVLIIDLFFAWRGCRKLLAQRLPNEPRKGLLSYFVNRAINPRRLRMPPPRVQIGDEI